MKKKLSFLLIFTFMLCCIGFSSNSAYAASTTVIYKTEMYTSVDESVRSIKYTDEDGNQTAYTSDPLSNSFQVVKKDKPKIISYEQPKGVIVTVITTKFTITDRY